MKFFVCEMCGFTELNEAPEICPVCGAPKSKFAEDPGAVKFPAVPAALSELEKKHIPLVKVEKKCGLYGPGCTDVFVKVGEIPHPMDQGKHWIMTLDYYLDGKFISRHTLKEPSALNAGSMIHMKADSGKLIVMSNCNLHGRWLKETEL